MNDNDNDPFLAIVMTFLICLGVWIYYPVITDKGDCVGSGGEWARGVIRFVCVDK